jgi:hypothetical protein
LIVGEHDQAIGVAEDVLVIRQDFLVGGLHQRVLALEQLRDAFGGQLIERRSALMTETERAAAGPGVLDDGVVGQRQGRWAITGQPLIYAFIVVIGFPCGASLLAMRCQST